MMILVIVYRILKHIIKVWNLSNINLKYELKSIIKDGHRTLSIIYKNGYIFINQI
jgi:hypothetical protein